MKWQQSRGETEKKRVDCLWLFSFFHPSLFGPFLLAIHAASLFSSLGPIDARRKKGTLILGHNSNKSWYFASGRGTKTLRAKKTSLRVKSGKSFPSIVEGTKPGFRAKWHKFYARFEMHFRAQIPRLTPHFLPPLLLLLLLLLLREWLFGFFRFLPSSRIAFLHFSNVFPNFFLVFTHFPQASPQSRPFVTIGGRRKKKRPCKFGISSRIRTKS